MSIEILELLQSMDAKTWQLRPGACYSKKESKIKMIHISIPGQQNCHGQIPSKVNGTPGRDSPGWS